jgi:PPOX class probable F420-dependent enzyme
MPRPPLPPNIQRFLEAPHPAVVGTVRPDGAPATTATWYGLDNGMLLLSMTTDSPRTRNIRKHPYVALTILADNWYDQLSIRGRVVTLRDDPDLADLDDLSRRYWGKPYPKRHLRCTTALVEITQWRIWGDPTATSNAE